MSISGGLDSYPPSFGEWLYSILASITSTQLVVLRIELDTRHIHYTSGAHLIHLAEEFMVLQAEKIDELLCGKRFRQLRAVEVNLRCNRQSPAPGHEAWDALIAPMFSRLGKRNILSCVPRLVMP